MNFFIITYTAISYARFSGTWVRVCVEKSNEMTVFPSKPLFSMDRTLLFGFISNFYDN